MAKGRDHKPDSGEGAGWNPENAFCVVCGDPIKTVYRRKLPVKKRRFWRHVRRDQPMSGRNPPKTHFWRKSDKHTRCGRKPGTLPLTSDQDKVTCGQCLSPERPYSSNW